MALGTQETPDLSTSSCVPAHRSFGAPPALLALLLTVGGIGSACLLEKRPGATAAIATAASINVLTATTDANGNPLTCAPAAEFKQFSPGFFSFCTGCHSAGGSGAGKLVLESGSDDESIMKNYITTMRDLILSVELTDGEPVNERLLKYPLGSGHTAIFTASHPRVAEAANWMVSEWINDVETPCAVVRPGIGLVD